MEGGEALGLNRQSSLERITDANGVIVSEYAYTPWGGRILLSGADITDRGYTGHEHLTALGLINMNGRVYDPVLARFLSPDPYVQAPDFTQAFNRYSYAFGNPFKYVDPSGEIVWFVPVIIGAVIGAYTGASIQSGTAAFWDWKPDAWKGAIAGGIIGATLGYGVAGAIGATGMTTTATTAAGTTAKVTTKAAGLVSSMLNSGSINIGLNALSGGGWDGAWKAGVVGMASGAWNATGGLGMVKGFGATSDIGKLAGKLGYQMIGTAGSSIGNNWARGENPFSKVTLGVGPVNLTLGKGQKLLQWQNNIGNIGMHSFGLINTAFGGKMNFDWKNLSLNYKGGLIDKMFPTTTYQNGIPYRQSSGFSPHVITGNSNLAGVYSHELHHLWQSRAFNDVYLLNYALQGINALLMGGKFVEDYNYYEDVAYGEYWW
jgi:RHS repeat-associated protein